MKRPQPQLPALIQEKTQAELGGASKQHLNVASAALIAMEAVEAYSATGGEPLSGPAKLHLAKATVPNVLEAAVNLGVATEQEAQEVSRVVHAAGDIIGGIVEAFVALSKNPEVIQLVDTAKQKCCAAKRVKRR